MRFELLAEAERLAPELLAVIREAFEELRGRIQPESSAFRETLETIRAKAASEGVAVARAGEEIAGCLFYRRREAELYIGKLAVRPAFRRRGVAAGLVALAEEQARAESVPRLALEVRMALPGNVRLFQACGFEIEGTGTHEGFARPTFYRMAKAVQLP